MDLVATRLLKLFLQEDEREERFSRFDERYIMKPVLSH